MSGGFYIPRHGKKGNAFLGIEFKDAFIPLAGIAMALPMWIVFDVWGFIVPVLLAWHVNKIFLHWKSDQAPGFFQEWLFSKGWLKYGKHKHTPRLVGSARPFIAGRKRNMD